MNININIEEVIAALRDNFIKELSTVPKEKADAAFNGVLSEEEVERALVKADNAVRLSLDRFIEGNNMEDFGTEYTHALPEYFTYVFLSPRRIYGREDAVSGIIFDTMVNFALAEILKQLNLETAQTYETVANDQMTELVEFLYIKKRPTPKYVIHENSID